MLRKTPVWPLGPRVLSCQPSARVNLDDRDQLEEEGKGKWGTVKKGLSGPAGFLAANAALLVKLALQEAPRAC